MCGRFALVTEKRVLELLFEIELAEEISSRYNIAPSEMLLALRCSPCSGRKELIRLQWGLVPAWTKDKPAGRRLINVRAETAAGKFGSAFRRRRVLIPASGFYEWRKEGKLRQPFFIHLQGGRPFTFAGLYEPCRREEKLHESCAIITTAANSLIKPIHHRMPLIIPAEHYPLWLDPHTPVDELQKILLPYPAEKMSAYPVSRMVNNPAFDHPDCLRKEQPHA